MDEKFFLKSPTSAIIAEGQAITIDTPAFDAAFMNGRFQKSLEKAFTRAKEEGIESPIVVGAIPFDPRQRSALYIPERWQKLTDEDISELKNNNNVLPLRIVSSGGMTQEDYTQSVEEAIKDIRAGELDKVVLGRTQTIEASDPVDTRSLISRLLKLNPNGYNFHLPLPDGEGALAGSSPELLIRKDGEHFTSQPLAGSAGRGTTPEKDEKNRKNLLASKKDLYEHRLVVDWMRKILTYVSPDLDAPDSPHTISTPKLWHLATTISGSAPGETSLSLAGRLHPTPALSGFPHEAARELLDALEPFDRRYFGGIVGYTDSEGNGEWFIAIRCLQYHGNMLTLFAGAGIVADSDPESEWRETALKLTTMQGIFN